MRNDEFQCYLTNHGDGIVFCSTVSRLWNNTILQIKNKRNLLCLMVVFVFYVQYDIKLIEIIIIIEIRRN
jgi:hypothetical protein